MANKVILVGNMTRDIEVQYTNNGMAIGSFSIAVNRKKKNQSGNYENVATFIDIKAFANTAEVLAKYTRKGMKIYIEGRLEVDRWTAKNGNKRSKMYVVLENFEFVEKKEGGGGNYGGQQQYSQPQQQQYNQPQQQYAQPQQQPQQKLPEIDVTDEEIPF